MMPSRLLDAMGIKFRNPSVKDLYQGGKYTIFMIKNIFKKYLAKAQMYVLSISHFNSIEALAEA